MMMLVVVMVMMLMMMMMMMMVMMMKMLMMMMMMIRRNSLARTVPDTSPLRGLFARSAPTYARVRRAVTCSIGTRGGPGCPMID